MAYWVLVIGAIIGFFLLRKRIFGGLVVLGVFIGAIFLIIFILDWWSPVDVRDYADVGVYDAVIEDPLKVGEDLASNVYDRASELNNKAKEVGDDIDTKLGIEKGANGVWTTDSGANNIKLEESVVQEEVSTNQGNLGFTVGDSNVESSVVSTDQGKQQVFITYEEAQHKASQITPNLEDQKLIQSMTPYNLTKVEGVTVIIQNTEDGITITTK